MSENVCSSQLKVGGACNGSVEVASLGCSVASLRQAIADTFGLSAEESSSMKIIASGRSLTDLEKPLSHYGITVRTKLLLLKGRSTAVVSGMHEVEERTARTDRLKGAVAAMAARTGDTSLNDSQYSFEVENQRGEGLSVGEDDRRALAMGLALHNKGQRSLNKAAYQDALQELLLAEEAFQLPSSDLLQHVDNVALLMIDLVWCFYKLQDVSSLASAQQRLESARSILQKSHGPNFERLRVLHGNFCPELARYVRLELLEGIVAYYSGNKPLALQKLQSAYAKWERLQVSDEHLASLAAAGFTTKEATRALRFCEGDVDRAAQFVLQQREETKVRKTNQQAERAQRKEQRQYGRTSAGKSVNMDCLEQLSSLGYARPVVAQALCQTENNIEAALDLLTDPNSQELLQQALSASSSRGKRQRVHDCREELKGMGFSAQIIDAAFARLGEDCEMHAVLDLLVSDTNLQPSGDIRAEATPGPSTQHSRENENEIPQPVVDQDAEQEIAKGLKGDPLSAYDVDVVEEGHAIQEYLTLLASSTASSSSQMI